MENFYVISEQELLSLLTAERELSILKSAGIDNWNGYPDRYEYFDEDDYPKWTLELLRKEYKNLKDCIK